MSETENKNQTEQDKTSDSLETKSSFGFKAEEEETIGEICNRFLNIFRQIHVLNEDLVESYNEDLRNISDDAKFELYSMPGGLELIDYITFVRTGEKINTRRLRARQKQEEELGLAPAPKEKEAPAQQIQQPVVQYIPMPMGGSSEEGVDTSAMMAQMAQMAQMMASSQSSFSSSELAGILSQNQKEIMNAQTKNFLEGQKIITSSQTKDFIESQKALLEMQSKLVLETQKSLFEMQTKFVNETREILDKSQIGFIEMQKQVIGEMSLKLDAIISKISENKSDDAKSYSYENLPEIQEKLAKIQADIIKDATAENVKAFEKVADGIKEGLRSLSVNVSMPNIEIPYKNQVENDENSFKINSSKSSHNSVFVNVDDVKEIKIEKGEELNYKEDDIIDEEINDERIEDNIVDDLDEVEDVIEDNVNDVLDEIEDVNDTIDDIKEEIEEDIIEEIKEKEFIVNHTVPVEEVAPLNDFSKKDKKDDGFFIPEQGSINNLPTPGVMTKEQKERAREGNVGFAINDGSYKVEKQSYEHDLFGKNSPKVASRFKSKKSGKDNGGGEEKEEKKGIFSVFKKK